MWSRDQLTLWRSWTFVCYSEPSCCIFPRHRWRWATTAVCGTTAGISGCQRRFPSRWMAGLGEGVNNAARNKDSSPIAWVSQQSGGYKRLDNKAVTCKAFSSCKESCETVNTQGMEQKSLVTVSFSWWCITWMLLFLLFFYRLAHLKREKRYGKEFPQTTHHLEIICWDLVMECSYSHSR